MNEELNFDKLHHMFLKQIELQEKLKNEPLHNQKFITEMTIVTIDELMEALRETPWKSWKKTQTYNKEKFQNELIDAWHFMINLTIASGMTSHKLYTKFLEKNKENINRQKRGY